jgi:hypothetical protein
LAAPSNEAQTQAACDPGPIDYTVHPYAPTPTNPAPRARLQLRISKHRHPAGEVVLELRSLSGRLSDVEIELERGHKVLARAHRSALGAKFERVVLRHHALRPGRFSIVIKAHGRTLLVRSEHLLRAEV